MFTNGKCGRPGSGRYEVDRNKQGETIVNAYNGEEINVTGSLEMILDRHTS